MTGKKINHIRNNNESNGAHSVILCLTLQDDPEKEVRMEASRDVGPTVTTVTISAPLPNPEHN